MFRLLSPGSLFFSGRSLVTKRPPVLQLYRKMTTKNTYSLNALKRWSCSDNELPTVDKIKVIHVYDFDNTLFASPLPNRQLWQGPAIGVLQTQEAFITGGWWHDPNILKSTGEGFEIEEPRAWHGWWNEQIADLVELSMQQKDAVTVLLTGRTEKGFADIIQKMVKSKDLEFDLIALRPEIGPSNEKFSSTMKFKQAFFEALVRTYSEAESIKIYEDRPRHVEGFRDFFDQMNESWTSNGSSGSRKAIQAEVIEVTEKSTTLDPVTECAEVQKMINAQNLAFRHGSLPAGAKSWEMKKTVFFTGYLLAPADSDRLLQAAGLPVHNPNSSNADLRVLANSILITPRPCPPHILERVGGMGKKLRWRATATGNYDDKVFAAKVEPVPPTESVHFENKIPLIVLALRGEGKPIQANRIQNWKPLPADRVIEFDTVVGEKKLLRIEPEQPMEESADRGSKRSRLQEEDFPPLGRPQPNHPVSAPRGPQQNSQKRSYHNGENRRPEGQRGGGKPNFGSGRGGGGGNGGAAGSNSGNSRSNFQRGRGGSDGKGRGKGGYPGYRSLDDETRRKGTGFGADGTNDEGLSY